jgi:hypothetical protein
MKCRRWAWRLVVASPAVVLIGLVGVGLSNAEAAQASKPVPCPSPTDVLSAVTSTACQTVQQVTAQPSAVASTALKTAQKLGEAAKNLTGNLIGSASSGQASSGGTSSAGKSPSSGSGAHQSHGRTRRPAAVGTAPAGVGVLLAGGPFTLFPLSPVSQQLIFPKVYPARHTAARAAGPSSRVLGRMWLLFLIGGVGLVVGAGGYFLGWPGLRRRCARTTT